MPFTFSILSFPLVASALEGGRHQRNSLYGYGQTPAKNASPPLAPPT